MASIACAAAVGFPVGFSTEGTPVGMQIFGPPGSDGINLSLLRLVGEIFGETEPPPFPSLCNGCTANVTSVEVCVGIYTARSRPCLLSLAAHDSTYSPPAVMLT